MSQTKNVSIAKRLAEAALLIAMGTVLSVFKLIDLPYGGSVTVGSMLPVLIIAYRYGTGFGMASSLAFGIIQQLLGLKTLSYVTTWQSILAVILLDYIVAFMVIGLGLDICEISRMEKYIQDVMLKIMVYKGYVPKEQLLLKHYLKEKESFYKLL